MVIYKVYWKGAKLPAYETTSKRYAENGYPQKERRIEVIKKYKKCTS